VIIPLFKTHYSIGKSILTLSSDTEENAIGPNSVIDLAVKNNISDLFFVEDSFMGFLEAKKACENIGVNFIFAISLNFCDNISEINEDEKSVPFHKINIFSKSSLGCKILYKIYSECHCNKHKIIDLNILKEHWDQDHLSMSIPFYDSFLFKNLFSFDKFCPSLTFFKPTFFIEDKGLPFDSFLKDHIVSYASQNKFDTQETHTIYYKDKKDFDAFLSYKLICSRSSYGGFKSSLEKPNLDHMSSDQFSFESYLKKCET
jgi:DNA polymerase III alpha subunit